MRVNCVCMNDLSTQLKHSFSNATDITNYVKPMIVIKNNTLLYISLVLFACLVLFPKREKSNHSTLTNHFNHCGTSVEHFTRLPLFQHPDLVLDLFLCVFFKELIRGFREHFTRLPFFQHLDFIKPGISMRVE